MSDVILDASALLAVLLDEPGGAEVAHRIEGASISSVNLAEVVGRLVDGGAPAATCREVLSALDLRVVPFDEDAAHAAGALRPLTRRAGLSLGDRACLALAMQLDGTALTADRAWKSLRVGVKVEVLARARR